MTESNINLKETVAGVDGEVVVLKVASNEQVESNTDSSVSSRKRSSSVSQVVLATEHDVGKKKRKNSKQVTFSIPSEYLKKRLSIKDIRDLTLFLMNSTNNAPQWIEIANRSAIKKMIVLFAPGVQQADFKMSNDDQFFTNYEQLQKNQLHAVKDPRMLENSQNFPVSAPGSRVSLFSAYNSFVNVGLTKKEKEDKKQELSKKQITITDLILEIDALLYNNYPIHPLTIGITENLKKELSQISEYNDPTWVDTIELKHDKSHIFALDCEMCMSKNGLVLTRVSVIDFDENVIYESFVKPDVPITDYLTKYSGITEDKLKNVTTTLKDIQNDLLKLFSKDDILIGHSLQSDLNVLKMRHPKIVDTAICFDHKAGPPFKPSLRYLTSEYLHREIQNDDANGHDSVEDAKACLELVKMKIVNGLIFGCAINTENMFHRLSKIGVKSLLLNDSAPFQKIVNKDSLEKTIKCTDDETIFKNIVLNTMNYDLIVGRLRGLEFARNYAKPSIGKQVTVTTEEVALETLGAGIENIYNNAPSGTLVLVLSGTGNTLPWNDIMNDLNKLNKEDKLAERQKKDAEIQEAVLKARDGVATMIFKQ